MMPPRQCQQARLARDHRYDGLFFTAVKTTGIYCRSVCPAPPPLEKNVEYFETAFLAAQAGYRPCLRCRPDSAPGSSAWRGTNTTFHRALSLIDEGGLVDGSLPALAERLGVSPRYVRLLFQQAIGMSPKSYSLYQQCLLAKKLLHETALPITEIALASGFGSLRRFNDCFKMQFSLAPSVVRKQGGNRADSGEPIRVTLAYRPPYDWRSIQAFYAGRMIKGLEWVGEDHYGRTFSDGIGVGWFTARHCAARSLFEVEIYLFELTMLPKVIRNIRRCLDLDANSVLIDHALQQALEIPALAMSGMRLPGIWSPFEAGIRAILGQQVSIKAARNLVTQLVAMNPDNRDGYHFFPSPEQLLNVDLEALGMPARRRETLRQFAAYATEQALEDHDALLALPGIGPWTVNYLRMRGFSDPDIFLDGDLGIKKSLQQVYCQPERAAPWRSYLTLYLWNTLE
ncbi:DNA-3-methyladenine glycosylase 2 family protein [Photobacterium nomapromontoriensis]|uniref:DNA-3-methyladenine glycosylase 2 family protein n=1 Tax=Photobacterium nomapromontoriensis TaxID=2910237 RepID=UPI003D12E1CA